MVVIIPKEILKETGTREGDTLKLAIPISKQNKASAPKNGGNQRGRSTFPQKETRPGLKKFLFG